MTSFREKTFGRFAKTQPDISKVLFEIGGYVFINSCTAFINFALTIVLTRFLSPLEMGSVAIFLMIVSLLIIFIGLNSVAAVLVKYVKLGKSDFKNFLSSCLSIGVLTALSTFLCLIAFKDYIEALFNLDIQLVLFACIFAFTQFISNMRLAIWQGERRLLQYGSFQIAFSLFACVLILSLVLASEPNANSRIVGSLITGIIFSLLAMVLMIKGKVLGLRPSLSLTKQALRFGVPLLPHLFSSMIIMAFDRIAITKHFGQDALGVYFIAWQFSVPILMLGDAINRAGKPWFYKAIKNNEYHNIKNVQLLVSIAIIMIAITYGLLVYILYPIIVGEEYQGGRNIACLLVISASIHNLYYLFCNSLFFFEWTVVVTLVSVLTSAVYVAIVWNYIELLGIANIPIAAIAINIMFVTLIFTFDRILSRRVAHGQ